MKLWISLQTLKTIGLKIKCGQSQKKSNQEEKSLNDKGKTYWEIYFSGKLDEIDIMRTEGSVAYGKWMFRC